MAETNPYAPPGVAETHREGGYRWHVDGIGVLVKHGAILPQVDLESGVRDDDMTCTPVAFQGVGPVGMFQLLVLIAIGAASQIYFKLGIWVFVAIFLVFSILGRFGLFAGLNPPKQTVWIFSETKRVRTRRLRRWLRIAAMILTFAGILASLLIPVLWMRPDPDFFPKWLMWALAPGVLVILGIGVWGVLDRPKTHISAVGNGWLRVSPVHADAISYLHACERERDEISQSPRKRRVRTLYYHRYPLRMLVGGTRNPWHLLYLGYLKLLRSRLLVREAWHFSEVVDVEPGGLCEPLRAAMDEWLGNHADWLVARTTRDIAPAGDMVTELVWLASPGFQHCLMLGTSWYEQAPRRVVVGHFFTWLADNKAFTTINQPTLSLSDPELHQLASGEPEQLFEAHLRGLAGHTPVPPADLPGFLERIRAYNEQTDRLLTEQGYQSETREVSV